MCISLLARSWKVATTWSPAVRIRSPSLRTSAAGVPAVRRRTIMAVRPCGRAAMSLLTHASLKPMLWQERHEGDATEHV